LAKSLVCVKYILPFIIAAVAQTFFGSLVGAVTDATGASVPNATVNVINTGTSERRTAQTDSGGNYQFVNLVPGMAKTKAEKAVETVFEGIKEALTQFKIRVGQQKQKKAK
jgi:carboxypeptidase family protein